MNTQVMFSSKTDQWATPLDFFDKLNEEFHFTLDPCADEFNHKCDRFFSEKENGLVQDWSGETVFLQSSIRQGNKKVGSEVFSRGSRRGLPMRRHAHSITN